MPGIVGIYTAGGASKEHLRETLERIAVPLRYSAGQPLHTHAYSSQAAGVVTHGFAIQRPALAERDGVIAVIDGEIFPEVPDVPAHLKNGAATIQRAEYCLHRYLDEGPGFIDRLNGVFGLAIVDSRDGSIHIGADRFGHRLLFYRQSGDECAFASSLRSLLLLDKSVGRAYDPRALAELIVFERILGDRTLFTDVRRLPAGCRATWRGRGWDVTRYFSPRRLDPPTAIGSWQEGAAELERRLRHSLTKRLADRPNAGLFLSGGLDSRLVLGCASEPLTAMTFSHPGSKPREAQIAERLARAAGAPLLLLERDADCYAGIAARAAEVNEGLATFVACHSLASHRQIAEAGVQVIVTGDRSDVTFKDYFADSIDNVGLRPWSGSRLQVRRAARKLMNSPLVRRVEHQDLMMLALSGPMKLLFAGVWEETLEWLETLFEPGTGLDETLSELALCDWQGFTALGMLRGISTDFVERSPFFDNDVWSLSMALPIPWRADARMVKRAITIACPRLAAIPDVTTGIRPDAPARIARAWSTTRLAARGFAKGVLKRTAMNGRLKHPGTDSIFTSSGFHDRDLALKFSKPYQNLVRSSIESLPQEYFDVATVMALLDSDLQARSPSLGKLFEIVATFSEFSRRWGIHAQRASSPEPSEVEHRRQAV